MSTQPTNLRYYPAEPWELRRADYLRRSGRPLDPKVPVIEKKRKEPEPIMRIKDVPNPQSDQADILRALEGRAEERDAEVEGLKRRVLELEAIVSQVTEWAGLRGDLNGR